MTQWDFLKYFLSQFAPGFKDLFENLICIGIVLLIFFQKFTKFNPVDCIFNYLGKRINRDTNENLKKIETKVDSVQIDLEKYKKEGEESSKLIKAELARHNILIFGDEIRRGMNHSEEHFIQINADRKYYRDYVVQHPEFENERTNDSCKIIQLEYDKCLQQNAFLRGKNE